MTELHLYTAFAGGLLILALAGDLLVNAAVSLASRLSVSPLVTAILVVGFGTSLSELMVTLSAILDGAPALALGTLVGSNIANIWFVLAVPALFMPVLTGGSGQTRAVGLVLLATAGWIGITAVMPLTPLVGAGLLAALAGSVIVELRQPRLARVDGPDRRMHHPPRSLVGFQLWAGLLVAIIGLPIGASLIVEGGVGIARQFDIPEEVIGLTLLAVGTSLPELGAGIAAALRGRSDVVVGNILGSNLFNLLGAAGLVGLFGPVAISPGFADYSHWALAGATLTLVLFILPKAKISRLAALAMLMVYAVYLYGLVSGWNVRAGVVGSVG